jgi:regulator of protease activity HflC (stomatin/prohibitin superfamily)
MITISVLIAIVGLALVLLGSSVRVIAQYERGVVFRFGRVRPQTRGPGLAVIAPIADRLRKVNMQIITQPVPAQDGITRDNVTVRVDAVLYYRVVDPVRVAVDVADYSAAILQVAQASLRSIIGKSELDDLLSNRERLNQGLELMIDSPAVGWGVHIDRVEIKDVALPESMKRSMSRQAEAERERRSRVITAEGELQASRKLADAAEVMAEHPAALQLRLLQTVVEVAAEKNSTLVLPFPVELLRFLERATPADITNSDITSTASIVNPTRRSGPPDAASTATESASAPGAGANGVPQGAPIGNATPRPAPPDVASTTTGPTSADGARDDDGAQDAPLSIPLRQRPAGWWG